MLPFSGFSLSILISLMATMAFFTAISLMFNFLSLSIMCIRKYKDRSLKISSCFQSFFTSACSFLVAYAILLLCFNKDIYSIDVWFNLKSVQTEVLHTFKDFPNQIVFTEAITGKSVDVRTLFSFMPAIAFFLLPVIVLMIIGVVVSHVLSTAKEKMIEQISDKVAMKINGGVQ